MKTVAKIVLGIIIAFILIVGGCAALIGGAMDEAEKGTEVTEAEVSPEETPKESEEPTKAAEEPESDSGTVVLRVTGNGTSKGSVTFSDPNMQMTQETNTRLPWTKKFKVDDIGILGFSITAQNNNGSGSISCSIEEEGEIVSENTSKGGYAVVTCN